MSEIQNGAEENFARRIAAHLLEKYPKAIVTLPDKKLAVDELPPEKLHELVRVGIERARPHELTFESSIAVFCVLMFEVAPNFDVHKLVQVVLSDENLEPHTRFNQLFEILMDKNWETIKSTYDAEAWQPKVAEPEEQKVDG